MSTYSALVMASSPLAYYRLSELTGTTAFDQTSNAYNGTYRGTYALQQQNAIIPEYTDYAVTLDGKTASILLPPGLSITGAAALTVELWLNPTSLASTALVIDNDNNVGGSHVGFFLELTASASFFDVGNGTIGPTKQFPALTVGAWSHVVGVYDGAHLLVYVNGIPDATTTNPALTGTIGAATHNVTIGANVTGGNFFTGSLDEIAIYTSALSASTITSHYTTGSIGRTGITPFPPAVRRAGTFTVNRRQS